MGMLFLGFFIGFLFKGLLTPKNPYDTLLYWDAESLGWRPVLQHDKLDPARRYMAATEVMFDRETR